MKPEEINDQLNPILKSAIAELVDFENYLVAELKYYRDNHEDWLASDDFRPGAISRILASVIAVKFVAKKTLDYLDNEGWYEDFKENFMPEPWKGIEYYGHMKEIALMMRFHLIHSIYSNMEATLRVIVREKGLNMNTKPAFAVNELTGTYDQDEVRFIDFIRNTIHNNGMHFPNNNNYDNWKYNFEGKNYHFVRGEAIYIDIHEVIRIVRSQVESLSETLKHKDIVAMDITKDVQ